MYVVGRTTGARWVKKVTRPECPVPSMPLYPRSSNETMLIAVLPSDVDVFTWAFQRRLIVMPGGMSSRHVSRVFPPALAFLPGVAAAHPEGVMVHPVHGSSNPQLKHQVSSSVGTVSHTSTFHQVFMLDRFFTMIE